MIGFILADLRQYRAAALVIVLLVALSTALGVTVTLEERALRLGSARAADKYDLVVGAAGSETQLVLSSVFLQAAPLPLMPGAVLKALIAEPGVAWAAPIGFGDNFRGYPIVGTTTALIAGTASGFIEGQVFALEGEAVLGSDVPIALGAIIRPMHGLAGEGGHDHAGVAYRAVGRLTATGTAWDRAILVPIQAVWHVHGLGLHEDDEAKAAGGAVAEGPHDHPEGSDADEDHDHHGGIDADAALDERFSGDLPGLPAVLVKPKTVADAYKLRQRYRQEGTLAVFPGEVLTRLYATLGDARRILVYVAAGAQVLVAAALLLVTVVHVAQRRRQIGALRAFGAPRLAVFGIVWGELILLLSVGLVLGHGLGFAAAKLIASQLRAESGVHLPVAFTLGDLTSAALLLAAAALMAAMPALVAYRQSPAAALRA
ncbi:FtsX-like permease family protein [Rhizobium sp. YIM 134829]|uniref:FtsX-like permease family protein n=1 Tax=Rhizobium sp. YIM 134829 TaxID=3390453 RepID=UPI00397C6FEF